MAFSIAASAAIVPASDERDLFAMPSQEDFRLQEIERQPGETDWPFVSARGMLACAFVTGRRQGYFVPRDDAGVIPDDAPGVPLSGDPVEMLTFYLMMRDAFVRIDNPAELVRRVAPLADTAKRLCDQPRGTDVPRGDL
ncbi:hypothetical protein ACLB6G_10130 [Zhengella sp. ZM62]|uniref:hypothetical protein n=1 Tax=Zhengella sedimenti TaxID=3390035 RepID=UPI0039760649